MEKKNEVVISKEFNKNFTTFKNAYKSLNSSMGKASHAAYMCVSENKKEFTNRCKETFPELSQSTISKMVNAGLVIAEADKHELELPDTYSKIYELAPVKEQLDNFYKYVEKDKKVDKEVSDMSLREIRDEVDKFLYDEEDVEDEDVIDGEATEEEIENDIDENNVEESATRSNLESIADALANIIDTYNVPDDLAKALADIETDIRQVANNL